MAVTGVKTFKNFIGGDWVDSVSGESFESVSPADGETLGVFPKSVPEDVDRAVAVAKEAFEEWRLVPAPQRGEMSKNGVGSDSYEPPAAAPSPGTGWGGNQKDRVHEVQFTPERFACTQVILRYEYERGLVALGILPYRAPNDRLWEREHGTLGFAQPPTR